MPGHDEHDSEPGLERRNDRRLARKTGNPRFAYDCYRRFIQMFGEVVAAHRYGRSSTTSSTRARQRSRPKLDTDLTAEDLKAIIADYKKIVKKETGKEFPAGRLEQLMLSRDAVFNSWNTPKADLLPANGEDSGFHRHRRQRASHGVRQHGRNPAPASALRATLTVKRSSTANFWSTPRAKTSSQEFARRNRSPNSSR